MGRIKLSQKKRFDVFKRDAFVCQYCGRTPPEVVLEVDHITAVVRGGTNDDHNLITSCFDCNRGKATGDLKALPIDAKERAMRLAERVAQTEAYEALLRTQKIKTEENVEAVVDLFLAKFGREFTDRALDSVRQFLAKLPLIEVEEAMELACLRIDDPERAYKYFCGVCWRKIKGDR